MNCKTVQNSLSAYLDREIAGDEMLAIRAHLSECDACRAEEEELRMLKRLLLTSEVPEPPADLAQRLTAAIRAENPVSTRSERRTTVRATIFTFAGVAACSMALTFAVLTGPRSGTDKAKALDLAATKSERDLAFDVQRDQVYAVGLDATGGVPIISTARDVRH